MAIYIYTHCMRFIHTYICQRTLTSVSQCFIDISIEEAQLGIPTVQHYLCCHPPSPPSLQPGPGSAPVHHRAQGTEPTGSCWQSSAAPAQFLSMSTVTVPGQPLQLPGQRTAVLVIPADFVRAKTSPAEASRFSLAFITVLSLQYAKPAL